MPSEVFTRSPEPQLLGREDFPRGERWDVTHVEPVRGQPVTCIAKQTMSAPMYDDHCSRSIRAHEMVHAKVSPVSLEEWMKQTVAKESTLIVAEEARVNFIAKKLGFMPHIHLSDGSEHHTGENAAKNNNWAGAVLNCVMVLNCAGFDAYIRGIKKHKPEWEAPLKAIAKKINKFLNDPTLDDLMSTGTESHYFGRWCPAPAGFLFTETIATWLEGVAEIADGNEELAEDGKNSEVPSALAITRSKHLATDGSWDRTMFSAGTWGQLNVEKCAMLPRPGGAFSKKRVASPIGKNPRRLTRALTDPDKRIFDAKRRGMGGVVLIDVSGSMRITLEQVQAIVDMAPGATVATYAEDWDGSNNRPNLHIVAMDGKIASELPAGQTGNNVDLPALEWAVKTRKKKSDPIVWVSDGQVTCTTGELFPAGGIECINLCRKESIITVEETGSAIAVLKMLNAGRKPHRIWPSGLKECYELVTGGKLQ